MWFSQGFVLHFVRLNEDAMRRGLRDSRKGFSLPVAFLKTPGTLVPLSYMAKCKFLTGVRTYLQLGLCYIPQASESWENVEKPWGTAWASDQEAATRWRPRSPEGHTWRLGVWSVREWLKGYQRTGGTLSHTSQPCLGPVLICKLYRQGYSCFDNGFVFETY